MEEFKEAEGKTEAAGEGEAAVEEFFPIKSTAGGAGLASASASLVAVQVVRPTTQHHHLPRQAAEPIDTMSTCIH